MKALTLRHPWPFAICHLGKRIENRGWEPSPKQLRIGDRFAIHGGVAPKRGSVSYADPIQKAYLLSERFAGVHFPPEDVIFRVGIVAVATFGGITLDGRGVCDCGRIEHGRCHMACPSQSVDPWFDDVPNNKGWMLRDLFVLPTPIQCKGAQGLWDVSSYVLAKINEQLS